MREVVKNATIWKEHDREHAPLRCHRLTSRLQPAEPEIGRFPSPHRVLFCPDSGVILSATPVADCRAAPAPPPHFLGIPTSLKSERASEQKAKLCL
jgi:hypothetical protein